MVHDFNCKVYTLFFLDLPPSPTGRLAPMTTTTLMRENDLIPNIQDLEKMFDTDEECDPDSVVVFVFVCIKPMMM